MCFVKKGAFKNFTKFIRKNTCARVFFNKVAGATSLKNRLWPRCFPLNFEKFLKTPFLQSTPERLLLYGLQKYSPSEQNVLQVSNNGIRTTSINLLMLLLLFWTGIIPQVHSWRLLVQSQQWKHQKNMWDLFQGNKKDLRTTSLMLFWCLYCSLWTDSTHCFAISVVEFE